MILTQMGVLEAFPFAVATAKSFSKWRFNESI